MIIKKKQLLAATLIMALGAAIFVNWYFTKPVTATSAPEVSAQGQEERELGEARYVISGDVSESVTGVPAEYFSAAKLNRQTAHDKAAETLNGVIKDSASAPAAIKEATAKLTALAEHIETETALENLITAKVNGECLVSMGEDGVQVVVEKGKLNATAAMQIQEILTKQTDFSAEKITIIEFNG